MRVLTLIIVFLTITITSSAADTTCPSTVADEVTALKDTLTVSVVDTVNTVSVVDTVNTVSVADTIAVDTVKKRDPWYVRFYRFAGSVLSPKRDLNYIDVQDYYNWCAELQLTSRFESYEMDASDQFSMRVAPDARWRVGPFFGWRFAFLGYNFDLKSLFFNSDDTDLCGSIYSAAFGLDLFYRRVGGNYKIKRLSIGDIDYTDKVYNCNFDGIHQGMTRLSFYYILNYKHYSHQAAFNQTHRQIRSAGSPILGIQYAHNTVSVDVDKLISLVGTQSDDTQNLYNILQNQKNDEISLTGGYGYNWVFAKNWLAAGELTGSFGYLVQHTNVENPVEDESKPSILRKIDDFYRKNIAFNGNFRFAVLWNNGPWFAGAQVVGFYYQYGNGTVMTRDLLGSTYIFVGFNF